MLRKDARIVVATVAGQHEALLEITSMGEAWLYGFEDWRDDAGPSYGWDATVLRQHDGQRFYGDAIATVPVSTVEAEAKLRATWPDQDGIFIDG